MRPDMCSPPPMPSPTCTSSLFTDDDTRWQAVCNRDTAADGLFVYAVRTTRIYCRPICKARLARRANVSFYETPREAREAGFRACKRCKPEMEGSMPDEAAVKKIRAFVSSGGGGGGGAGDGGLMSLGQMAKRTGLSKWHFHRVFKKCVGVTPVEYVRMRRRHGDSASNATQTTLPTPTESESPATLGSEWLQQLEMGFGAEFESRSGALDPALATDGTATAGSSSAGEVDHLAIGDNMSWADLLAWPDDDYAMPP